MRVAFLVLTLLAVGSSEAGHTQNMDRPMDRFAAPAFSTAPALALPVLAMNNHTQLDVAASSVIRRSVNVPQMSMAAASLVHPPMAGRGAALIQPLSGMRPAGQPTRSISDHLLTGLVAVMLIAYQLRRKHRVLRPHPFSN